MVKFLTRPGCHLCEEALPVVREAARRAGLEVKTVDVESDDALVAEYGLRIPVVLGPDGTVLWEGPLEDPRALRREIRRAGGGRRLLRRLR